MVGYSVIDHNGDHLLGCGHKLLRIHRHESLCDIVYHSLHQGGPFIRREQRLSGASQDRPCYIFHSDFLNGKPTYFDLTVRNSLQPAGVAGLQGEQSKDSKYASTVEKAGGEFVPLAVETLGLWTPFARKILSQIAARTIVHSCLPLKLAVKNLMQLSVKLWSYNAKMILHYFSRQPCNPLWDSPFD